MKLNSIQLENFRNYKELNIAFSKNLNIILGKNAQGKTNLLESIYVLAMTRSHRSNNENDFIFFGEKYAKITGIISKNENKFPMEMIITAKGKKTKVNHLDQKKLSDYIGQLNVILFSPDDLSLVKGSPQNRRKFLDMEIGQISSVYLYQLLQYQKVLKQRNFFLKQLFEGKSKDEIYLNVLTEQLVQLGADIIYQRIQFINELEQLAQTIHTHISFDQEKVTISYESTLSVDKSFKKDDIKLVFFEELKKQRKRERLKQTTFLGPHRDDLLFRINGQNVQVFGSQGQQRTTVLSLKLAEVELMKKRTNQYPILLLDDVLSELDNNRQIQLLDAVEGKVQTFITTTGLNHIEKKLSLLPDIFDVHQGKIERKSELV